MPLPKRVRFQEPTAVSMNKENEDKTNKYYSEILDTYSRIRLREAVCDCLFYSILFALFNSHHAQ